MILLTGATGLIGGELLPIMLERGETVRTLVRDPRRLGERRVEVQIALGDLSDPFSLRHAMRGIDTVIHLAAAIRDRPEGTIEELNALATWRLLQLAEQNGVKRFVFFSAIGATGFQRTRFFRAKATAERAVRSSPIRSVVFAPSIVYGPEDPWVSLVRRLSILPVMAVSGSGGARYQPIWARDVARCVAAALDNSNPSSNDDGDTGRYELAGPDTLTYQEITEIVMRSAGRERPLVNVPLPLVRTALRAIETLSDRDAFATWEEAELMEVPMTTDRGTEDAERLGVDPRPMAEVLRG